MRYLKIPICIALCTTVLITLVGCHDYNKNEIIEPLEDYENFMIEAMQDKIAITGVSYKIDDYVTFTIVLLSDDNEYQIVEDYMEQSAVYLTSNPKCILNEEYAVTYNFNRRNNSNGSPGEPICRLTNIASEGVIKDHIVMADFCLFPDCELQGFNGIEEVICTGYSDDQIDSIIDSFPNLKKVYVESEARVAELEDKYPNLEIMTF